MRNSWLRYIDQVRRRSERVPPLLARLSAALAIAWAGIFIALACFRVLASPVPSSLAQLSLILATYSAIALAPSAGLLLAAASFPTGLRSAALTLRLPFGRWRPLDPAEARRHPLFGPAGFMASLLVGLLLNVVVRSIEFLIAVPAIGTDGPDWAALLFMLMAADVGLMSFLYIVCFVMALRSIPLFPRMLAFVWLLDVFLQLFIAHSLSATVEMPDKVARPLATLLDGNITKVMISMLVWLPYLTLSERVNVTYRQRISA